MAIHNLVDVSTIIPNIVLDIRYATEHNFLGFPLYTKPTCYLHRDTAEAVHQVQKDLNRQGYGIKIFDGYRPLHVQQMMWDLIQNENFVSNPAKKKGGHTRGTAIDLTLVDPHGNELEMPSEFDEFTERAHCEYPDTTPEAMRNRALLKSIMEKHGFTQYPYEWWHFDFKGWDNNEKYPPLDATFEEIDMLIK